MLRERNDKLVHKIERIRVQTVAKEEDILQSDMYRKLQQQCR